VDIRKVILDFVLLTAGTAVAHGTQVRLTAGTAVAHGTQVRLTAGSSMGPHNDLTLLTDRSSVAHTEHFSLDHEPARSSLAIQNTYFGFIVANVPSFAAYIVHHYPQCINWYAAKCEAFQILVTQQCQDEYANVELFRSVPQHIIETYPFEITVGNQGKTMYGNMFFYLFWRSHGRPIKPSLSINQSNTFKSDAYHFLRRICTLQPLEFWQSTTSPVTKSFTDATTLETPMKIADWYQHIFGASDHDVVYARARKLQNASTLYVIQWRARVSNVLMDLYPDIMTIIEAYVLHPRQVVLFV
jgi:hypothetical protein